MLFVSNMMLEAIPSVVVVHTDEPCMSRASSTGGHTYNSNHNQMRCVNIGRCMFYLSIVDSEFYIQTHRRNPGNFSDTRKLDNLFCHRHAILHIS